MKIIEKKDYLHLLALISFCVFVTAVIPLQSSGYNMVCNVLYVVFSLFSLAIIFRQKRFYFYKEEIYFLLFSLVALVSAAMNNFASNSITLLYSVVSLTSVIIFTNHALKHEDVLYIEGAIIAGSIILGIWSLALHETGDTRLGSEVSNSIAVGMAMALCSILLVHRIENKSIIKLTLFFFSIILVFLTQTRGAIILAVFFSLFVLFFEKKEKKTIPSKVFFFCMILVAIYIGFSSGFISKYTHRFEDVFLMFKGEQLSYASTSRRVELKEIGCDAFFDKPILGHGIGTSREFLGTYFHDNFVELAYEMGLLGLITYYIPFFICLFRSKKNKNYFSMFLILFMLVAGVFDTYYHSKLFYIVFSLCMLYNKKTLTTSI